MSKKFAIGIPTLNRFDLLKPALLYYEKDFPNTKIFILDNGKQEITSDAEIMRNKNIRVLESEKNRGVAASWNVLCDEIFKSHDFALILNDDDYLGADEGVVNAIVAFALSEEYKGRFYCPITHGRPDFDSFLISKEIFEKVGRFDEKFYPAYYEDDDYIVRLHHAGVVIQNVTLLHPILNRNTSSIGSIIGCNQLVENNRLYFLEKWGSYDPERAYKQPFNKTNDEN